MVNMIEYRKMKTGINTINHPGRDQSLQYIDYHSAPATPPSKANLTSHLAMYLNVNNLCNYVDILY